MKDPEDSFGNSPSLDERSSAPQDVLSEAARLREQARQLREQLKAITLQGDPRFRLAALNLMEDAEEARRRAEVIAGEREQAERSLRETEEQFRRAIEHAPTPVILFAEDGQVLQVSRTWTQITGTGLHQMGGFYDWCNRALGPAADSVRARLKAAFSDPTSTVEMDLELTTRSGDRRSWVFTVSVPGSLRDGRRFAAAMALDTTERKRAEMALRQTEERMRLIVESAREFAIFSTDLNLCVTSWSLGASEILGFAEEEILGRSADVIFVEEDRAAGACEREAQTALAEGRAMDERWHRRKDGSRFWGSGALMTLNSPTGETIGFVKVLRDRTAEKQTREALAQSRAELEAVLLDAQRARDQAEAANRTKDTFLATLSHELRTPLVPVLITAESLLRKPDLPQRVRDGLQTIIRNVELETHFINDLLDLTRISRGKFELLREPVDLHEVIRSAVEISDQDLQTKKQKLSVTLGAEQSCVLGDPPRLQQVFWNILKNASKFTAEAGEIQVSSRNERETILVTIRDSGMGIHASQLTDIFEAFHQGDRTITRDYGGLGLGLAICKATIEQLDGQIWAESAGPGLGATMMVQLPIYVSS